MKDFDIKLISDPALKSLFSFLIKGAYSEVKKLVNHYNSKVDLSTSEKELSDNVIKEVRKSYNWASSDLFANHNSDFGIHKRYVHLDLLLEPRRSHSSNEQILKKESLNNIVTTNNTNIVILGQPGSGKTTTTKYIVNSILLDPYFLEGVYSLPIVIRLRELNRHNSILDETQKGGIYNKLSQIFGIHLNLQRLDHSIRAETDKILTAEIIASILDNQKILLILDGFDEISDYGLRDLVIEELKNLSLLLNNVNFIMTSRGADFNYKIENTATFEISELNDSQIEDFANKWFEDQSLSKIFLAELFEKTPYKDFYRRPLLLTHLASIYSKSKEIPDKPKLIYQTIIDLVLKEWNENQGVKRLSKYSNFSVNRKREFLSAIAFYLTIKYRKTVFSSNELREIYILINPKFSELPLEESDLVIQEIESHNGVILKSGFDNFEFSHLTIQEFLVADYILKGGGIRLNVDDLLKLPYELAVVISLSTEPSIILYDLLVEKIFAKSINMDFLRKFTERLEIEKPDFEIGPIFIITLLCIYTKIANQENETVNFINDRLKFEQFLDTYSSVDFIKKISDYYQPDGNIIKMSKSKVEYIGLRKKKDVQHDLLIFTFPRYLIWSKEKYENQEDYS